MLGAFGCWWVGLSTAARTNPMLYDKVETHRETKSQEFMHISLESSNFTYTRTAIGDHLWWASAGVQQWAMAAISALPLPFETLAAEVRWMDILRSGLRNWPSLAAFCYFCYQPWGFSGLIQLGKFKYGWPSVLGMRAVFWHWVFVGRLQFAEFPSQKVPLFRRVTVLEWLAMGGVFICFLYYPMFDVYCIQTGQVRCSSLQLFGDLNTYLKIS